MDSERALLDLFRTQGQEISVVPNTPISLQTEGDNHFIWYVEEGSVNLFAIELKEGHAEGPRTFLSNCNPPSLLFSIDREYTAPVLEVFAIAETHVKLWQLKAPLLEEALQKDPSLRSAFAPKLESWIHYIAQYAEKDDREKHDIFVTIDEERVIEQGESFSVKRAVDAPQKREIVWIQITQGISSFLGTETLTLDSSHSPLPLTYHLWLKANENLSIHTFCTESMLDDTLWRDSLKLLHRTLFHYYLTYKEEKKGRVQKHLKIKLEEENETLNTVFKEMVSLLNPEEVVSLPSSTDPLFKACLLLGKIQRIHFELPSDLPPHREISIQIAAIANASEVRYRQVKLTKGWWKEDSGPLLAFHGVEQKPVVLRRRRGFYEMIDPETKNKRIVTPGLASDIIKLAYTFYRPFPNQLTKAREAISFFLQTNVHEIFPIILFGSIGSILSLFFPFATERIFNRAIPDTDTSVLMQLCLGLFLSALSTAVFFYLRSLGLVRMAGYASNGLQAALWDRLLKLPASFFRQFTTGNLVQKVTSIEQIRQILSDNSSRIILSGIFSFFYLLAMLFYSPLLSLMAILLMSISFAITIAAFYYKLHYMHKIQNLSSVINGVLVQIISGVGKLRVAGAENNAFSYWAKMFTKLKRYELSAQSIHNVVLTLVTFLPILSYAVIFGTVMMLKESGGISLGAFLGFNAAFTTFSASLFGVSTSLMDLVAIPPLWNNVRNIIEAPLENIAEKAKTGTLTGEISIDNISFKYAKEGPHILENISLHVNPKEFVALVGPSGSGKSTLVRLLLGFETPSIGTIYYDNNELPSLNLHDVRKQIGTVLQTGGIISGTLYDNIVCGGVYPKTKIDEALALSGFIHDIDTFPMGLHTFIPMGGETLSGGQKQRLLIARALLPEPKILIFDEATSALDNKVQDEISRNLDALDVTRVVIAHRLSTIKHADRIYVIDKGHTVETGTFQELATRPGLFQNMLNRQKL